MRHRPRPHSTQKAGRASQNAPSPALVVFLPPQTGESLHTTMSSSKASSVADAEKNVDVVVQPSNVDDPDAEFGGCEARQKLERGLLRKLDMRMSSLIVV